MSNILIIGNGFDLYHGLPTRYTDFLFWVNHWDEFNELLDKSSADDKEKAEKWIVRLSDRCELIEESIEDFAKCFKNYNADEFDRLDFIVKHNGWIKYFFSREDQSGRWIDFENEILHVLQIFENAFNEIEQSTGSRKIPEYSQDYYSKEVIKCFFTNKDSINIPFGPIERNISREFVHSERKKSIIQKLNAELNDLVFLLRFYLMELVLNININVYSEQIKLLGNIKLLSFNYTDSFRYIYGSSIVDSCVNVHGSLVQNDIVLGVGDDAFDNLDYVYFQKYFQRIQKKTGSYYREWLPVSNSQVLAEDSEVYIMGHSLDPVDSGILRFFFDHSYVNRINIFYHKEEAYEGLVLNLIKLIGKERTIEEIGKGRIQFIKLKPAVIGNGKAVIGA